MNTSQTHRSEKPELSPVPLSARVYCDSNAGIEELIHIHKVLYVNMRQIAKFRDSNDLKNSPDPLHKVLRFHSPHALNIMGKSSCHFRHYV